MNSADLSNYTTWVTMRNVYSVQDVYVAPVAVIVLIPYIPVHVHAVMNISVRVVFKTAKDIILMNIAIWTNIVVCVLDAEKKSSILDVDMEDILCTAMLLEMLLFVICDALKMRQERMCLRFPLLLEK